MRTILVIIVTATVTVVICQWRQEPAPFCCPGGKHVLMEGGKWKHELWNPVYNSKLGRNVEGK